MYRFRVKQIAGVGAPPPPKKGTECGAPIHVLGQDSSWLKEFKCGPTGGMGCVYPVATRRWSHFDTEWRWASQQIWAENNVYSIICTCRRRVVWADKNAWVVFIPTRCGCEAFAEMRTMRVLVVCEMADDCLTRNNGIAISQDISDNVFLVR